MPLLREECFIKATQSKTRTLPPLTSVPLLFKLEAESHGPPSQETPSREYKAGKKIDLIFFKLCLHFSFHYLLLRIQVVRMVS